MLVAEKSSTKIADRIENARSEALSTNSKTPNQTQKILEDVYGKKTKETIDDYAVFNDKWHNFIDI